MEKKGEQYAKSANKGRKEVLFKEGDLVWVHWRKERFPHLRRSKLIPREDGPFKILKKINDNTYQLNKRHIKWIEFLEQFPYIIKHIKRYYLLFMLETKLLEIYELCVLGANVGFYIHEGFLFKDKKLCIPKSSITELLTKEAHGGSLMGNLGEYKTYKTLLEHFF
ncbi:hypothetical protein CR513_41500, partial [Mucuna pruriens]